MTAEKVVVFGAGAVGKSCLVIQFVQGYFVTDYDPTIEDTYKRQLTVNGESVTLDILDTAGQDDFAPMRTTYMRQGKGFLIVYAIDDRASFEEVDNFYNELKRTKNSEKIPIVLCGNKCDLEDRRVIAKAEGEELARKICSEKCFFETSALSNTNIEESFKAVIEAMRDSGGAAAAGDKDGGKKKGKKKGCLLI